MRERRRASEVCKCVQVCVVLHGARVAARRAQAPRRWGGVRAALRLVAQPFQARCPSWCRLSGLRAKPKRVFHVARRGRCGRCCCGALTPPAQPSRPPSCVRARACVAGNARRARQTQTRVAPPPPLARHCANAAVRSRCSPNARAFSPSQRNAHGLHLGGRVDVAAAVLLGVQQRAVDHLHLQPPSGARRALTRDAQRRARKASLDGLLDGAVLRA